MKVMEKGNKCIRETDEINFFDLNLSEIFVRIFEIKLKVQPLLSHKGAISRGLCYDAYFKNVLTNIGKMWAILT
jgi:hypothetical protein